ncbi:hypothetical protein QYF61_001081 [Mycteria americana]|uniref:ribonuclease H n=1 Tax=Mycteria americana TaxID=33587 RepID=A0AAN7MA71_MYCAM|nr:hypothetical protein QYF61_001081 [Mycteria americana]
MELLQAVLQPKEIAIMHCKAHQKGNSEITKGNRTADHRAVSDTTVQRYWKREVSWFSPSRQLRTTQPLAHPPPWWDGGENRKSKRKLKDKEEAEEEAEEILEEDSEVEEEIVEILGKVILHIPPENAWKAQMCLLTQGEKDENADIPEEVLNAVIPLVWASGKPGRAKSITPIKTELKSGAQPVRKKQYPIRLEARKGLEPLINSFLEYGLLRECQSELNTPILPSMSTLWCQNLYALLASIPENNMYFTVLDLKDAFFCIPVDEQSQLIFAFEWESPTTGRKTQLCWTVLPQGFKNSPTLFGNVLAKELEQWQCNNGHITLLQYVDDLLIGSSNDSACFEATISLLNFLGLAGYRVSKKKRRK